MNSIAALVRSYRKLSDKLYDVFDRHHFVCKVCKPQDARNFSFSNFCPEDRKSFLQYFAIWQFWTLSECIICCFNREVYAGHFPMCPTQPNLCVRHCRPESRGRAEHENAHNRLSEFFSLPLSGRERECPCRRCLPDEPS